MDDHDIDIPEGSFVNFRRLKNAEWEKCNLLSLGWLPECANKAALVDS